MIKALGHVWDNGVITQAPKGKKAGIKTYTCTRCNLTKTETAVSPKENTITAANVTLSASAAEQVRVLNATAKDNAVLTYASSDPANVSVDENGRLTIAKNFVGKASITITAEATSTYSRTVKTITVTVKKASAKKGK